MKNRALTQWRKSDKSYQNYQRYLEQKTNRFDLSLIDLLYVSNFKGGNGTINEEVDSVNRKLKKYSEILQRIQKRFCNQNLKDLSEDDLQNLIELVEEGCALTDKKSEQQIDGFRASYLSALLNSYFPELIPIIDRRVLINMELIDLNKDLNSQQQVIQIEQFYPTLINRTYLLAKETQKSLRTIDKEYFIISIEKPGEKSSV